MKIEEKRESNRKYDMRLTPIWPKAVWWDGIT